mgnify:CR=1 FL=1
MGKRVRVKMEVRRYVEEIYWIDEEIEIPDGEENIEEYIKDGIYIESFDLSNSQITIQEEEKTIELIEEKIPFTLNINEYLDKSDWGDYKEEYEELKNQTYHLKNDYMQMGFKSVISGDRIEIPIKYDIKNNVIIIHNMNEIEKNQEDYHEEYSIKESVINSIIEEFIYSLRFKEDRETLGITLKDYEDD